MTDLQAQFRANLPKSMRCCDDYSDQQIRKPSVALKKLYIAPNPPWEKHVMLLDVDMDYAWCAWESAILPQPSFTTVNPDSQHAHYGYMLNTPVLMGHNNTIKPMQYMAAVERGMVEKLGADTGYAGHLTQNPMNRHWQTTWTEATYDLGDLAEYVELKNKSTKSTEAQGVGRNCDMFEVIRHQAYRDVMLFKPDRYPDFQQHIFRILMDHTSTEHSVALHASEVQHTAKSIAAWTWKHFSAEGFRKLQQHRNQLSVMSRKQKSAERRIQATDMLSHGHSKQSIADSLGIALSSVYRLTTTLPAGLNPHLGPVLASKTAKERVTSDMANKKTEKLSTGSENTAVLEESISIRLDHMEAGLTEQQESIRVLTLEGKSMRVVADELGISAMDVHRALEVVR